MVIQENVLPSSSDGIFKSEVSWWLQLTLRWLQQKERQRGEDGEGVRNNYKCGKIITASKSR